MTRCWDIYGHVISLKVRQDCLRSEMLKQIMPSNFKSFVILRKII